MSVIVVANPKGGVGKSTLSTNLAGWLARQGRAVMLGDIDRQQSSLHWLGLRPPELPLIRGWERDGDDLLRPPKGITHAVLDTPAGMRGKRLDVAMKLAQTVLVPLQPSPFDMAATKDFLDVLRAHKRFDRVRLGLVVMRAKENTHALDHLQDFLGALGQPPVALLRDTQNYVHLAARGLSLFDVAPGRVERDLAQWQPLIGWLSSAAATALSPSSSTPVHLE